MGPGASVIDLTADSPEAERAPEPRITRSHRHHHHGPRSLALHLLIELEVTAGSSFYSNIDRGVRRMADLLGTNFMSRASMSPPGNLVQSLLWNRLLRPVMASLEIRPLPKGG